MGRGATSKVKLAIRKLLDKEEKFAIKIINKNILKKRKTFVKDEKTGKNGYKDAL